MEYYPIFEEALGDSCDEYGKICEQVQDVLVDYLHYTFDNLKELKDNIECIEISKKRFDLKKNFLRNCFYSYTQTLFSFVTPAKLKESLYQKKLLKT